jgi:N-acetylmuramoyl-L-alanine amidase
MTPSRIAISLLTTCALLVALIAPASAAHRVHGFRLSHDFIHYGHARKQQMARYSKRHYGHHTWRLHRKRVIVLHFTGGTSWRSARNTFAANSPDRGEMPGVCAHYIVDRRGIVHQIVRLKVRCRHTIGLNHRSIGVEMVQPATHGSHWADRRILHRHRQIRAALHLVHYLKHRFHIRMRNVIGHAMANHNRFFKDLEGWRNDHTDWLYRDVKTFRHRLRRI